MGELRVCAPGRREPRCGMRNDCNAIGGPRRLVQRQLRCTMTAVSRVYVGQWCMCASRCRRA